MLAVWSLLDSADIKTLNPSRTLMTTAANTVAMLTFVVAGVVQWPQTLALGLGALAGGYGGAHLGRKLPPWIVRAGTIIFACVVTVIFFLRAYRA
jgi:uncharacterized membrane protein YfcA